ncbi:MAG TPA: hypothetical protein VIA81_04195, partial [Acidimicrobiia bacterium]
AVDRFPEPGALTLLGEVYAASGNEAAATNAFATVAAVADLQAAAGAIIDLEMARFLAEHGEAALALPRAQAAYDSRPTVLAAEVLGWVHHRLGHDQDALTLARESVRLGTPDASLLLHAAAIFEANGLITEAVELRSQAAGLDPWYRILHPGI